MYSVDLDWIFLTFWWWSKWWLDFWWQ